MRSGREDGGSFIRSRYASLALIAICGLVVGCVSNPANSSQGRPSAAFATPNVASPTPTPQPSLTVGPTPTRQPSGSFSPTGSMPGPRAGAAATLLRDGQVLITGGDNAAAELYDPRTGMFSPTGSMLTVRMDFTATLLANGRVLIAGGHDDASGLASAEIYDPDTGRFTPTGSMATGRQGHTATLLADGSVLIAGGENHDNGWEDLASAEIYDPDTGRFTPTGSMAWPRSYAMATRLQDGRVLLVGGFNVMAVGMNETAEIYDPSSGTFRPTGSMAGRRAFASPTLLPDGRVLVAGGYGTDGPGQYDSDLASAELFVPSTGKFSPTGSLSTPRDGCTTTLLADGRVLIAGGWNGVNASGLASAEIYDPKTGKFSPTGSMSTPRFGSTATILNDGRVLIAGGRNPQGIILASAEIYQP